MLEKAKNVVCSFRNWQQIIGADCRHCPGLYEMQVQVLRASLMRAYPGVNCCPTPASAVVLQKMFRVNSRDPDAMLRWMDANPRIVWFAWKEFIEFALQFNPALHSMLAALPGWTRVAASVTRALDMACDLFNRTGTYAGWTEERVGFDCNAMLKRFYDSEQVVHSLKVKKENFVDLLLKRLNQHFTNKHKAGDQRFLDTDVVPLETARKMDRYIARLAPDEPLRPCDLYIWSVGHATIDRIFAQRELYERSPMPDNAIRNRLAQLVDVCPRDFHLLHLFVNKLVAHRLVSFAPLSRQTADRQMQALRRKYSLMPWQQPSRALLESFFCDQCVRPHFPVVKPPWTGFKNANEIPSYGHREVCYYWSTGTIRCTKSVVAQAGAAGSGTKGLSKLGYTGGNAKEQPSATGSSKRTPAALARSAALKKARAAQERRLESYRDPADAHSLTPVCFVGAIVTIKKQRYVACEQCFSVCHYSIDCFSGVHISCGHHREDALSLLRPLERFEQQHLSDPYTFASPFLPIMCSSQVLEAEAAYASASGVKPEESSLLYDETMVLMESAPTPAPPPPAPPMPGAETPAVYETCWFCPSQRRRDSTAGPAWRSILVLAENSRIERVALCPRQFSLFNGRPHNIDDIYDIRTLHTIKADWERAYGKRQLQIQRRLIKNDQEKKRAGYG